MKEIPLFRSRGRQPSFPRFTTVILIPSILISSGLMGCGPSTEDLEAVDYTPLVRDDWKVSTPAEQGLDPLLVAELYYNAAKMESLYGLLVIKNGYLIAEKYFNAGSADQLSGWQSVTKSVTSALVGIALDRGDLSNVDQKMVDFFPEFLPMQDARKEQITIRHLLQMRAGYPREDEIPEYFDLMFDGTHKWLPHIQDFVLVDEPGTAWNYSNLTSRILGVVVSRASDADLMSYAREHLFEPIAAELNRWSTDADGYAMGCIEIYLTARDMAKFGLLYLNDGEYEGNQVLSADWVRDSLQRYSEVIYFTGGRSKGRYFGDLGYGYQWWSACNRCLAIPFASVRQRMPLASRPPDPWPATDPDRRANFRSPWGVRFLAYG